MKSAALRIILASIAISVLIFAFSLFVMRLFRTWSSPFAPHHRHQARQTRAQETQANQGMNCNSHLSSPTKTLPPAKQLSPSRHKRASPSSGLIWQQPRLATMDPISVQFFVSGKVKKSGSKSLTSWLNQPRFTGMALWCRVIRMVVRIRSSSRVQPGLRNSPSANLPPRSGSIPMPSQRPQPRFMPDWPV